MICPAVVDDYLDGLIPLPDPVLARMRTAGERDGIPIVSAQTGRLLEFLATSIAARRVVEVGTAIGVSTLHLARAVGPQGRVTSFDIDSDRQVRARSYLEEAQVADRVELRLEDGLAGLRGLRGPFDLAFLDSAKDQYAAHLEVVVTLMRPGGVVVLDNALMDGAVAAGAGDSRWPQASVDAMRAVNARLVSHPQLVLGMVLAVGDGVGIALRRE